MKQYTSRELSEKLVKLGCKSQSNFVWSPYERPLCLGDGASARWWPELGVTPLPAFEFEDFCGTHEQGHLNSILLVSYLQNKRNKFAVEGDRVIVSGTILTSEPMDGEELVLEMIRSKDWLKYLEKVMEERENELL